MALGSHAKNATGRAISDWERDIHSVHGPFATRRRAAALLLLVVAAGLVLVAVGCGIADPLAGGIVPDRNIATVQLGIDRDGVYELTASALKTIGFDLTDSNFATLLLTRDGQSVPFQIVGSGATTALRFLGTTPSTNSYGSQSMYWLTNNNSKDAVLQGSTVETKDASSTGQASDVALATIHLEEQRLVSPKNDPAGDRWFWQSILAPGQTKLIFNAPGARGDGARLTVRFWGSTSAFQDPDHHAELLVNGIPIADLTWDGVGGYEREVELPAGLLVESDNRLEIKLAGDTGAPADAILLDWVDVVYQRTLELRSGESLSVSPEGEDALVVRTLGAGAFVWDVTDPRAPIVLEGLREDGRIVTFSAESSESVYLIADSAALLHPASMVPADESLDRVARLQRWPGGADLIIVTVPAFHEALAPLVAAREANGLRVALIDVEDMYVAFSAGQPTPEAIRALVQQALTTWDAPAPRFLLLAGDASYDSRDYLSGAEKDLVPTQLVDTTFTGWTASDVWFALPDDEPSSLPEVAVGRLPAQTADEMVVMVEKTLGYGGDAATDAAAADVAGSWKRRALLLADNDDPEFALVAQDFNSRLTAYDSEQIDIAGDGLAARSRLLDSLSEGVGLVGYFGHGSITLWAQEKIFSVDDAVKLRNEDRLPLLLTATCLSGFFQHPETVSLGEAMVRQPNGGAVAALVPSSAGLLPDQRLLTDRFAGVLESAGSTDRTLGELLLQAQRDMPVTTDGARQTLLTFNLLGDPSLRYP